ncbi:MAG: MBOAT family protein [bacterium]|nr:MBOAT family protein [bacterium]
MLFVESTFFVFFAVVLAVAWACRGHRNHKAWLLAASYFFYGAWDWRFLGLILLSTAIDYLAALRIEASEDQTRRRTWLWASLATNLGILFTFKYLDFFAGSATALLEAVGLQAGWTTLHLTLPVGISFFTFQSMSYTIDVYRREIQARREPLDFALFVAFFPQLVAGPIVRARDFLPQLVSRPLFSIVPVRACLTLFWIGFFKKACVGDNLALWIDPVYAEPAAHTASALIGATWLYAVQIYCDFSGYSDMAIATAGLLGYRLPRNFAAPYFSLSATEFWRRWHISLSSWLRDYLYISLGGNRHGSVRTRVNLMATMLLGGLWHGAFWNFVIWGGLHGLALVVHRQWRALVGIRHAPGGLRPLSRLAALLFTAWWVVFCWIFFRAATLSDAWIAAQAYLTWASHGNTALPGVVWPILALLVGMHALCWRLRPEERAGEIPGIAFAPAYGLAWSLALLMVPLEAKPFIYFQF